MMNITVNMKITRGIKAIFLEIILFVLARIEEQHIWESIYNISLNKMNFGTGGDFTRSGELLAMNYIKDALNDESQIIIFDVGANVGNYSRALSEVFDTKSRIYAFEPSKKTYSLFLESTKEIDVIIPHNFGFSDKEYKQTLFTNREGSGLASIYKRRLDHFGIKMDITEEIELTTIDIFCAGNNIEHIHFLKLDVEGHELNVLNGAKSMIERGKVDFIQFEFGGCNIDSRTYFQDFFYFLNGKYNIFRILKDGIYELPMYKETHEVFITVNYLAIKK